MLVVFLGPPGAGKGTQAKRLINYLEIIHLSTGDILRTAVAQGTRLGEVAREFINQGQLVPDQVMVDMIADRLSQPDSEAGCLLDGFPRTLPQARALDHMLADQDRQVNLVLALHVDRYELERRLEGRASEEGRADDSPSTISHRLEVYERQTAPLIEYYQRQGVLQNIDAIGTPDEVFGRIKQAVDSVRDSV
jgi:adenylate kinase